MHPASLQIDGPTLPSQILKVKWQHLMFIFVGASGDYHFDLSEIWGDIKAVGDYHSD